MIVSQPSAPLRLRRLFRRNPVRFCSAPEPATLADTYASVGDGDPPTPLIEAFAGDPIRLHVVAASSEQAQAFSVEGHDWAIEPGRLGSSRVSSQLLGGLETLTVNLTAGGRERLPGDYLYGDHREPYREAGMWGLFRVHAEGERARLAPLNASHGRAAGWKVALGIAAAVMVAGMMVAVLLRRPRSAA